LDERVTNHPGLWDMLSSPDVILYGEWCYAKHSIHYTMLPDYFIAFDIFLKSAQRYRTHCIHLSDFSSELFIWVVFVIMAMVASGLCHERSSSGVLRVVASH